MLDDTLVIWGGEFGRAPMSQGRDGCDHHIKGFIYLMAGGGIKRGISYDEAVRRGLIRGTVADQSAWSGGCARSSLTTAIP